MRIQISEQAERLIAKAQEHLKLFDGKRHSSAEALDWLLQDAIEHGSPIIKDWARQEWRATGEASITPIDKTVASPPFAPT